MSIIPSSEVLLVRDVVVERHRLAPSSSASLRIVSDSSPLAVGERDRGAEDPLPGERRSRPRLAVRRLPIVEVRLAPPPHRTPYE